MEKRGKVRCPGRECTGMVGAELGAAIFHGARKFSRVAIGEEN